MVPIIFSFAGPFMFIIQVLATYMLCMCTSYTIKTLARESFCGFLVFVDFNKT